MIDSLGGAIDNYERKESNIKDATLKMYNAQEKRFSVTRKLYYEQLLGALDSLRAANYMDARSLAGKKLTPGQRELEDIGKARESYTNFVNLIYDQEKEAMRKIIYDRKGYKKHIKKLKRKEGLDAVIAFNAKAQRLLGEEQVDHLTRATAVFQAEKFKNNCRFHQKAKRIQYKKDKLNSWAFRKIIKIEKYAFNQKKRQKLSKKYNKKIADLPFKERKIAMEKADQLKYFMEVYALIYNGEEYNAYDDIIGSRISKE